MAPVHLALLVGLCAATGSALVLLPAGAKPYVIAFVGFALTAIVCAMWPLVLLYLVVLFSAFAGIKGGVEPIDLGSADVSISGFAWTLLAGYIGMLLLANLRKLTLPRYLVPLQLFGLYVVVRWAVSDYLGAGFKDVVFYGLPPCFALYVYLLCKLEGEETPRAVEKAMLFSVALVAASYVIFMSLGLVEMTWYGPDGLLRPRPVALFLLTVFSLALAKWRYDPSARSRRWGAIVSLLAIGIIVFTMSRTASLVSVLMLVAHRVNPLKKRQLAAGVAIGILLFATLVFTVPALRSRFFFAPDVEFSESWDALNTMGRATVWPGVLASALERPVVGWGPSTARMVTSRIMVHKVRSGFYPHNEYLQIFHDTGGIGLLLALAGWFVVGLYHWRSWQSAVARGDHRSAKWNLATCFAVGSALLTSITDNTMHYAFVMLPAAALMAVGAFVSRTADAADRSREGPLSTVADR